MLRRYASPGQAPSARGTSPQPSCLSFEHTLSLSFMAAKRAESNVEAPRPTVREAMRSVLSAAKLVAGAVKDHGNHRPVIDTRGPGHHHR